MTKRSYKLSDRDTRRLGREVERCRVDKGYSQAQLAGKVGISWKHLWNIEAGNSPPSLAIYVALCRALGWGDPPMFVV